MLIAIALIVLALIAILYLLAIIRKQELLLDPEREAFMQARLDLAIAAADRVRTQYPVVTIAGHQLYILAASADEADTIIAEIKAP